jgi:hypothetical protein
MRRWVTIAFLVFLLLIPWQCIRAENWVQVKAFQEQGNDYVTNPFACNYSEWRIRYSDYAPALEPFPLDYFYLNITIYQISDDSSNSTVGTISVLPTQGQYYYHIVHNQTGNFFLDFHAGILDNYTVIVEQNIDSVLAAPTSSVMPSGTSTSPLPSSSAVGSDVLGEVIAIVILVLVSLVVVIALLIRRRGS